MIVVTNTTPLITLLKIKKMEILKQLFGEVHIPDAVYNEIVVMGEGKYGWNELGKYDFIIKKEIENKMASAFLQTQLDYGESETIILAKEMNADYLIIDEKKARKVAQVNGLKVIGSIGVLQMAKDNGFIDSMRHVLDEMLESGIWIDEKLYQAILEKNGEDT